MLTRKVESEILKWANYFVKVIESMNFNIQRHDATIEAVSGQVLELQHTKKTLTKLREELDALYNHLGVEFKPRNLKFDVEMVPEHFDKVKKGKNQ